MTSGWQACRTTYKHLKEDSWNNTKTQSNCTKNTILSPVNTYTQHYSLRCGINRSRVRRGSWIKYITNDIPYIPKKWWAKTWPLYVTYPTPEQVVQTSPKGLWVRPGKRYVSTGQRRLPQIHKKPPAKVKEHLHPLTIDTANGKKSYTDSISTSS